MSGRSESGFCWQGRPLDCFQLSAHPMQFLFLRAVHTICQLLASKRCCFWPDYSRACLVFSTIGTTSVTCSAATKVWPALMCSLLIYSRLPFLAHFSVPVGDY